MLSHPVFLRKAHEQPELDSAISHRHHVADVFHDRSRQGGDILNVMHGPPMAPARRVGGHACYNCWAFYLHLPRTWYTRYREDAREREGKANCEEGSVDCHCGRRLIWLDDCRVAIESVI